jgi:hypothetical protein
MPVKKTQKSLEEKKALAVEACQEFIFNNPSYEITPRNAQAIMKFVEEKNLNQCLTGSYQIAYDALMLRQQNGEDIFDLPTPEAPTREAQPDQEFIPTPPSRDHFGTKVGFHRAGQIQVLKEMKLSDLKKLVDSETSAARIHNERHSNFHRNY